MKPVNPKFSAATANARFLATITDTGRCPDFDADMVDERLEMKGKIPAKPNSFSRSRRHRIPQSAKDQTVE